MNVQVRGRNIEVTSALKEYVGKRVGKLDKYIDNLGDAQVTMTVEKDSHRIEVTIPINGMILRGEESTGDMYASIDLVVEKLEKQIGKYKGKLQKRGVRYVNDQRVPAALEEDTPRMVRTKRFAIKPMPVDEAVLQMNLLGHNFFVFSNAETEQVNVVYKRKDGNYGLIEPEF
ncbi:putative sigma-54 modulation protein [Pelotomaculum schinkii]|uniref:Ribosome hibernation promoting factor n=1 Tax=Pelotomaculum schinkii TaxID=78350 RepID=A0A4Y7R5R3_9FIRM|nr:MULTISPECIES: ribosome-associated translation inhibitor RaiA [Pelotomaculum]TEB04314.1 putative sigma-54 modulation protein [Pelotomaculum schinkii]TEB17698.1 putative sigma-54 modulation protein [Pelotomaculum sp. FP]